MNLPKGGGAIRGLGEKFQTNSANGTASLTVPVPLSKSRGEFQPALALSHSSGSGNGPFGLGWTLGLPSISRRMDKGVPRYAPFARREEDVAAADTAADIFLLSGAEDLVPICDDKGPWLAHRETKGYFVRGYRPRIEGIFSRIESWTRIADGDTHWRTISRDNVLTVYGEGAESRVADPEDGRRIFEWLICRSYDDRGNAIEYEYAAEGGDGVDLCRPNERFRSRDANRYLKRVRYGNREPVPADRTVGAASSRHLPRPHIDSETGWLFEVVFDYGDEPFAHEPDADGFERVSWTHASPLTRPSRRDPFSVSRAGFEVRTYRLCKRILVAHRMPEMLGAARTLVRAVHLDYDERPNGTRLSSITQSGYRMLDDGSYRRRSLPSLLLRYAASPLDDPAPRNWSIRQLPSESLENLPSGIGGQGYQWTDLDGEGIAGVLATEPGAWYYKPNRGEGRFGPVQVVRTMPASEGGRSQLIDLDSDGRLEFAMLEQGIGGYFDRTADAGWTPFRPFRSFPLVDFADPNVHLADLSGDGLADILITDDQAITWHPSLGDGGFGEAIRVRVPWNEEGGPRVLLGQADQSVFLADMSGDGLADLVRIRNGEVCYWPNLGHGRFGPKVTMDASPWFDEEGLFDARRLRFADTDGSGPTDILYASRKGVKIYLNESGNALSEPRTVSEMVLVEGVSLDVVDLLGRGTACLVWSTALPGIAWRPVQYIDLMCGEKPHLLVRSENQLGAETRLEYASSTEFYLADQEAGRPWLTRLPFPVHVIKRMESIDHVSRNRFVTRYAYHDGHYDGVEREFRGFGMVEQWDTEQFEALSEGNIPADNIAAASHVPPVHTKTWFHTGAWLGRERISRQMEDEYFREPGLTRSASRSLLLEDTILPLGLTPEEEREACRALKGSMLRQEVYADDAEHPGATPAQIRRARTPYTVNEQNFRIRTLQSRGANRYAVFFTHANEALSYHYERNPVDPRIQHALTLEVDGFGNVLKQAAIGYGRRVSPLSETWDRDRQTTALLTYTENRVTNDIAGPDTYRAPLPCEAITFELTGYTATGPAGRCKSTDLVEPDPAAAGRFRHKFTTPEVAYEAIASGSQRRRPIEWLRTLYRRDDLTGNLPLGELQSLALPGENFKLSFTPGLLDQVFRRPRQGQPDELLLPNPTVVLEGQAGDRGGYLRSQTLKADGRFPASDADDHWWMPSGQVFYSDDPADDTATELQRARQHFFLPRRYADPFGQLAFVDFDAYDLLMTETHDALGNRVTVNANDYRVLQPRLVSDPNRNQTEVAFDSLGMVVGTAVMGKPLPALAEGDSLTGFVTDVAQAQLDVFFGAADPHTDAPVLLRDATTRIVYDLDRFRRTQQANPNNPTKWQPACAATLARETHARAALPPQGLKIQLSLSYSDGFSREIQKKIQAEAGPLVEGGPVVNPRWVGSGWTIFNNKGKPVRQYEPFFSATHGFEFGVQVGVSRVLFYDPVERVIATLHPNRTYEKVVFDTWQQTTYDVNDTCAPRNSQTGDPRTDPDIGGYVAKYFKAQPATWQTWHVQRIGGALGQDERNAALRAAAHADTPTTAHFDALGRPFLTMARNRVVCARHDLDGNEENFATRVELDIEGNQRTVRDAILQAGDPLGRIVMRYAYDMLGNRTHQLSMEAGARWLLNDAAGKPIRAWDSRGHDFATKYDALRRPFEKYVRGTTVDSDPRTLNQELLVDKVEYGEPPAGATQAELDRVLHLNLRTRVFRHFDSAGVSTSARLDADDSPVEAYDFKGNLLCSVCRLISDYAAIPDWLTVPSLDTETFSGSTLFDALNRPTQAIAPHSGRAGTKLNVFQPVFNEANLLERVDVWLARATEPAKLLDPVLDAPSPVGVANIDYDAKGQRQRIDYKNGTCTFYDSDPLTFRLTRLYTRRAAAVAADCVNSQPPPHSSAAPDASPKRRAHGLQNLHYTYDPAGNITHIRDDTQQTIYFRNQRVEPSNDYTYDALYRLVQATGREHLGQSGNLPDPPTAPDAFNAFHTRLDHPGNGSAMGRYIERYVYDAVGNFLQMQHRGSAPMHAGWTRCYAYAETSLIEDGSAGGGVCKRSNRLSHTMLSPEGTAPQVEPYEYDAHGNTVRMPHLGGGLPAPNTHWDYKDQLHRSDLGGGGTVHCVYDASGQRVRKVWEKAPGLVEERIYLGGFEVFRKHNGAMGASTAALERETLHVMDDRQRIALVEMRTLDTEGVDKAPARLIRYQFGNHLGSASLELDDQARIISYEEYAPYGSSTYQAVRSETEVPKRYRFTGMERDEDNGLEYHFARYYMPWLGRWASCDPIGIQGGINRYEYCNANPVRLRDKNGTQASAACLLGGPETPWCWAGVAIDAWDILFGTAVVVGTGVAIHEATKPLEFSSEPWSPPLAPPIPAPTPRPAPPVEPSPARPPVAPPVPAPPIGPPAPPAAPPVPPLAPPVAPPRPPTPVAPPIAPPRPAPPTSGPRSEPPRTAPDRGRRPETQPKPEPKPVPRDPPQPAPRDRRAPRERVFLDTGALIGLAQGRPDIVAAIAGRQIATSITAFGELTRSWMNAAGPTEIAGTIAVQGMLVGNIVPDIPSPRVAGLTQTGGITPGDQLIFGTADALNLQIITGDARFVNSAAEQGVILNAIVVPPSRFTGR
ncbi:SpvB/TcaC N-terminal domain-containing protein [Variovorax sp. J31P207]|uniref:SpvB/TcaC N-terminal domain-containing protein n=1 Tax=Variovorax sp. J31P207 TaxID=3053510 RepID=UPI0025782186|nr:SpvB/TcaC N-terminal domain-containing protein [Variovorax sp. J31P207]MDM0069629.1 SpvB/TcaC N-terminal domain-containing protein [Variovorax sp. J31P207]